MLPMKQVIFALLFAAAAAAPLNSVLFDDPSTCAKRCLDNNKFDYNAKKIYLYEYMADSKSSIVGASEDEASIRIKASVEIEPTSQCDFEMRLKEVSLVDPYQAENVRFSPYEFARTLAKLPLRFSYQDGRIEDVCPHAEDPMWALNIKRGILSTFQNSMKQFDQDQTLIETDVTGSCDTKYTVSEDGSIIKTKDMVSCRNRLGVHSAVQSIGYDAESNIQSLAIMKTTYTCTQIIHRKLSILGSSTCTEKHIFRPFSNGDSGASTVNVQTLKFVETKNGGKAKEDEISLRTDLLFSHQFGESSSENAGEKIEMKLQELCDILKDDVRPEQPQLFGELVKIMKLADIDTLNGIYKQIKNQEICPANTEKIKKIFRDAIPMVGTGSSLQLISDLIWKREVIGIEKNMWLASLPFIQNPTKEMLSAIKPLLEDKNVEGNTILMISTLISGYCSVNPKCEEVTEFIEIMDVLDRWIGKCSFPGSYETTVYALRAIGNIGHAKSLVPRLILCFTGHEIPTQVRLAAIDAFRKLPCDVLRVDLLDLFNDNSKDSELRISAYLAIMKCPNKNIVMRVEEALRTEKNNQVGSFVWTHLTNLKETSDPHLQELRAILENQELKMEFNKDKRKFSRNYESSFFLDEINAGGKVDGNVIFSPESFVPRSANLNLTIDLFGRAINFFEFGTRMEGVDKFLERYFGNNGYFKKKVSSPATQFEPFDEKYKVDIGDLKGFVYMRMFGNELAFKEFKEPNLSMFKNFNIKEWVKDEKIAFHKNLALMDTQLIVPTIIGLPLNLTVAAMASIDLEATGKLNLASLENIEIGASIKPSAAVKVIGEITVDAFATKAGLRMNSLAHSSTEAKLSFNMKNSKVIESKFELPKKRMEIITFKSDYAIVKGDMVKAQKMIDDNLISKNKCTGETFNKVTGLKLCTQLLLPNASMKQDAPYFPLTGPVVMQIELINRDVPEGFIMRTHVNEPTHSGFIIDTPNSKVNRKISLDIDIKYQDQMIEFDSPWKKLSFNGKFAQTRNNKLISGELILDHKNSKVDKYSASLQLDSSSNKGELKWMPKMVIMTPAKKIILDGTITSSDNQKEADLRVAGLFRDEITFKMSAVSTKKEYTSISTLRIGSKEYYFKSAFGMVPKGKAVTYTSHLLLKVEGKELMMFDASLLYNPNSKIILIGKLDKVFSKIVALDTKILMNSNKKKMKHQLMFNLKAPKVVIDIKGLAELRESRFTSRVITTYNIGKYSDKLTISSKLLDESTKSSALYSGDLAVNSKKDLKNNFVLKCRIGKGDSHIDTKLDLEVGNPKKNPEKLMFESLLHFNLKSMKKVVNYTVSFERPSKNLNVGLKLSHVNVMSKRVETDVEVKNGPSIIAGAKVQFAMNPNSYEGFVSVRHSGKEVFRIEDKLTSKPQQKYKNYLNVMIPDGRKVILESVFEKESVTSYYISNTLRQPNNREITLINRMNVDIRNFSLYTEIDADRATLRAAPWNPNLNFGYHINTNPERLIDFRLYFDFALSPNEVMKAHYSYERPSHTITQDFHLTSSYESLKEVVLKHKLKFLPYVWEERVYIHIDQYYTYDENTTFILDDNRIYMDYALSRKSIDFNDKLKYVISFNKVEGLFTSNGEFKGQYPGTHFELKYNARANANRITLVADFMSETSRHRNSKLDINIAMDDERTSVTAKADVDYNSKRLCSLNTGYKYKDMIHNCQLAFLFANGERITTVFNLGMSGGKKTIHAEVKLPQRLGMFEMNMDGYAQCQEGNNCNVQMSLKTNTFIKDMEVSAEIGGNEWNKKSMQAILKLNGHEKLKLKGKYDIVDPRDCFAELEVMSKIGRTNDKFVFNAKRESNKKKLEISGMLVHSNNKYTVELIGKDYEEIKVKVVTPTHNFEAKLILNKLKLNDFDVKLTIQLNSGEYRFAIVNRHLQDVKLSVALAGYKDFDIVYRGGIDDEKAGLFNLKTSYGEYFVESNITSTLNVHNQFELKININFNIILQPGRHPKVHTGSGEIELLHGMDSIFQRITATFIYGKERITLSSLVKSKGKINMNIRLKTTFHVSATLKAHIEPDMYNTDLSLVFDTKWTGAKKLTYSHSGQKRKPLQINVDLGDVKGKKSDYTLSAKISMRNPYGLTLEVTTDKMKNRYMLDGELTTSRDMVKGKLLLEAPFEFMAGKPLKIMFDKAGPIISSSGSFGIMEYSINLEYSPQRAILKNYINWNKHDRASNFKFEITFVSASNEALTDKKFEVKLIHPVRSVSFSTKFVQNSKMLDVNVEFSGNVEKGQKIGFSFGKTEGAGYVQVSLPERTYKLAGRLDRKNYRTVFSSSFFWNLNVDDSRKIDLIMTLTQRKSSAVYDAILKFPSQTKGLRLKSELIWQRGDTLLKQKTEFSFNQDPANILTLQREFLKDDNNKYTLTMALMHPNSNTNVLATIRIFELNNKLTASMDMKIGRANFHSVAYYDKNNKEISLKVRSPSYSAEIFSKIVDDDDYEITTKVVDGSGKPMETYINFSPSRRNLRIKLNYDGNVPENYYKIDVSLLTKNKLMVNAFRGRIDSQITDILADFTIDGSNILHGKINWNPKMIYEFNEYMYVKMLTNMQKMKVVMAMAYANIVEESTLITKAVYRTYLPEINAIVKDISRDINEIADETTQWLRTISEMYDRDYLYVNTLAKKLGTGFFDVQVKILNAVSYAEYHLRHAFAKYYRILLEKMSKDNHKVKEFYRKLSYDIEQAKLYSMHKVAKLNQQWIAKRDEYLRTLNDLNRRTYQAVFENKYSKAILMALNQRWDDLIDFMRQNEMEFASKCISFLRMHINGITQTLNEFMDEVKNYEVISDGFAMANELYQQLLWAYNYWEVEATIRNLDDKVKNYITKTANGIRKQIFSLNQMELIVFDLRSGAIEFKFPLVVPKVIVQNQERFDQVVRMMKVTINKFNQWQPEYNYTVADVYYSLKPPTNLADMVPPFKAQASILRDQHITTFDGVHFDFKGACSYILTRDFVDNNFTVVANFGKVGKQLLLESVLFHAESEKLELFHDYQVRHNDQKVDLPIKLNGLSVNRVGNVMEISSNRGFDITFNPSYGSVIVDISGWYFGKVAGLFGTYNNEQFDDMSTAEKRLTTDVDEFAFSWALQGCKSRQNEAHEEYKLHHCDEWFLNSSSPFRNCFRQVEPDSFYHMCNTAHNLDPCKIARFYIDRCAEKGVPLSKPEKCLTCFHKTGSLKAGTTVEFSEEYKPDRIAPKADIVIVVEQRKCNKKTASNLNQIIAKIEQTLRKQGIYDNRYGLVAFGGDNTRLEYSVTLKSDLMSSAGLLMDKVKKLDFNDDYCLTDPLKAISLASHYPFRMATRKTIILATCNMLCHEKSISYEKVLSQLKARDIALHLLQKYEFETSSNKSPKTSDIYGIDSKQVFTKFDGEARDKMFETVKLPSGDCAQLTLASNGSVFDVDKMRGRDKTMFANRFSKRITDSLETANCQVCHCGQNDLGMPQSVCSRCPSIIPQSSPLYLPGKLFQGNFQINENIKEQLNKYWIRFRKKDLLGQVISGKKRRS